MIGTIQQQLDDLMCISEYLVLVQKTDKLPKDKIKPVLLACMVKSEN